MTRSKHIAMHSKISALVSLYVIRLLFLENGVWWFGHVERKDDADWVRRCMLMEKTRQERTSEEERM